MRAVAVLLIALVLVGCSGSATTYPVGGSNMEPVLRPGDRFAVDTSQSVGRGAIVMFNGPRSWPRLHPGEPSQFISRVIALGGDTVACRHDRLLVNGATIDEAYVRPGSHECAGDAFEGKSVTVARDAVFVMGDNRDFSEDSRVNGAVPRSDIVGVVMQITSPSSRARTLPD